MSNIKPPSQPGNPTSPRPSAQNPSQPGVARSTVPPRSTHETYHPGGYGVSEGLKRARKPFLVRNAATGGAIAAFAVGVYYYSISKVGPVSHCVVVDLSSLTSADNFLILLFL